MAIHEQALVVDKKPAADPYSSKARAGLLVDISPAADPQRTLPAVPAQKGSPQPRRPDEQARPFIGIYSDAGPSGKSEGASLCSPHTPLASQHPNALAAAQKELSRKDDSLKDQKKQVEEETLKDAVEIQATTMNKILEFKLELANGDSKNPDSKIIQISETCYQKMSIDEHGRRVTEMYSMNGSRSRINKIIYDPKNPQAPYVFMNQESTVDGDNVSVRENEIKYRKSPGGLIPGGYREPRGGSDDLNKIEETDRRSRTGGSGTSTSIRHAQYGQSDRIDSQDVVEERAHISFSELDEKDINLPSDLERAFDQDSRVTRRSSQFFRSERTKEGNRTGSFAGQDDYEQGTTRVSDTRGRNGMRALSVSKQVDPSTKISQSFVEGDPKTEITRTTVCGNLVTEETELFEKPSGRTARKIGMVKTERTYGEDGKVRHEKRDATDLNTGDQVTQTTTREVVGDTARYHSEKVETQQKGEVPRVTVGSGTNRIGPDGKESLQEREVQTPEGDKLRVSKEENKPPAVTYTAKDGSTNSASMLPATDGQTVIEFTDHSKQPAQKRTVRLGEDGALDEAALSPAEQSLLPTVLSVGSSVTEKGALGAELLDVLSDPKEIKSTARLLRKLGMNKNMRERLGQVQNGLGLLGSMITFGTGIQGMCDPESSKIGAGLDVTRGVVGAADALQDLTKFKPANKLLGKVSKFLGPISGGLDFISGIISSMHAKDSFDDADAGVNIVDGGATTVLGVAKLLGGGPPGWVLLALAGVGLSVKEIIDYKRNHYVAPLAPELHGLEDIKFGSPELNPYGRPPAHCYVD